LINYKTAEPHVGLCMGHLEAHGHDDDHSKLAVETYMSAWRRGLEVEDVMAAIKQLHSGVKRNLENQEN